MAGDIYYHKVSLLLPMTGSNGSTTFTDYSPSPKTVTPVGNAQISTALDAGGTGLFDGNGDFLSVPDSADITLAALDFTIECWAYLTAYPANNAGTYASALITKDEASNREFGFMLVGTASSFTDLSFSGSVSGGATTVISANLISGALNTWHHFAVARRGNLVYLFQNGTLLNAGGSAFSITIFNSTSTVKIGAINYDATYKYYLTGYMRYVRITNNVARNTTNFTSPDLPLPTYLEPRAKELYAVNQPIIQAFNPTIFNG